MNPQHQQTVARVIGEVTRSALRRYPWASEDDLQQEGWCAALRAATTWQASKGELAAYVSAAVRHAVVDWLAANTVIVSSTKASRFTKLALSRQHQPLSHEYAGTTDAPTPQLASEEPGPEELLEYARWRVRVLARLLDVAEGEEDVLDELTGERVRAGRPSRETLDRRAALRARIEHDRELRRLMREPG